MGKKKTQVLKYPRSIPIKAKIPCIDNSGAKLLEIVSVIDYHGTKRRIPAACIADMVVATVKRGTKEMRNQVVKAIIVRTRKEYRRPNGLRVKFESNAAVVVDDKGEPKGTIIKGAIAKEAVERWSSLGRIASMVI
jgi:large subunit ribosomal protein L14